MERERDAGLLEDLLRLPGVDAPPGNPGERVRLLRPDTLPGTTWILAAGAERLWRVFHEDYELCVLPPEGNARHAGATYTYRTWDLHCEPNAAYLLEPDTLHTNHRILGPANYYVVKVERATVAALADELGFGPSPHFRVPSTGSPAILAALDGLARSVAQGADTVERQTRLLDALTLVLAECAERAPHRLASAPSDRALARARDHLHEHFAERPTLDDLAAVSGLSKHHLVRSFARRYGAPPHAYLAQLRAAQARRQIASGTRPSEVDAGFYDQSHLTEHFKRAYAVTPASYAGAPAAA